MNGQTAGTAVTTTNLAAATEGTYSSWSNASAHQTFQTSQVALPAGITINGGTVHGCGYATQSLAADLTYGLTFSRINFSGSHSVVVAQGSISNLPPSAGSAGDLMDLMDLLSTHPYTAVMQLQHGTGASCGAYGIEIESAQSGPAHSSCVSVSPGGTYFFSFIANWSSSGTCGATGAPCAGLMIFSTSGTTFTQVGSTVSVALPATDTLSDAFIGQDENATASSTTLYFQNVMFDFTNHIWPNHRSPRRTFSTRAPPFYAVQSTFYQFSLSTRDRLDYGGIPGVDGRNIASLTMSAVSSTFQAHHSRHSNRSTISL